eukprot:g2974.t1
MAQRRRQRAAERVVLNVYDLAPANDYLHPVGMGLYHSGIVFGNTEWTFSSSGVFSHAPGAAGVSFREAIVLGEARMGYKEFESICRALGSENFRGEDYNLIMKNCNNFSEAVCQRVLGRAIPGWVNRLATAGSLVSCLLPKEMIGDSPVNGAGTSFSSGHSRDGERAASFQGEGRRLSSGQQGISGQPVQGDEQRSLLREAALARLERERGRRE